MASFKDLTGDKLTVRKRPGCVRIGVAGEYEAWIEILDFAPPTARAIAAALIKAADEADGK